MANGVGIAVPSQPLNLVDSLSTPYGLKELPPSLALKQQNINRRQHLANILLQRGLQPIQGQMAGRFYVPPSWGQGLAQLASAGLGAGMTYLGNKQTEELGQDSKGMVAKALEDYRNDPRNSEVPAVPPSQPATPDQTPPPQQDPQAMLMAALGPPPDQSNLPQTMPNNVNFGQGEGPAVHPMTGAPLADNATPPIQEPYQMPGLAPPGAAPAPQAQVAQAMTQGAMQGPMSPGTPARPRTPEERRASIYEHLMANEHPQAQEMGKMLLNQMQQEENVKANRDFQAGEHALNRDVTREGQQTNADLRKATIEGNVLNTQALISSREQMGKDSNDLKKQLAGQEAELKKMEIQTRQDMLKQGKTPPGYRQSADGNLEAIPGGPADMKKEAAFNQDTAILGQSTSNMDRLATAANEAMNHPGLAGITGLRGAIPNIPGSAAADAQAKMNTLKSQVAFGVLQDMRNNSKTGGALGNVSDAEGKRLEANLAALENAQSVEQMRDSLKKIIEYSNSAKGRLQDTFNLKHKGAAAGEAAPAVPMSGGKPAAFQPFHDPDEEAAYQKWKQEHK